MRGKCGATVAWLALACATGLVFFAVCVRLVPMSVRAASVEPSPRSGAERTAPSEEAAFPEVDWSYWQEVNPDVVGWVTVPGTGIDHPVVQASAEDPEFYLTHDVYRKRSVYGCPFLSVESSPAIWTPLSPPATPSSCFRRQGADASCTLTALLPWMDKASRPARPMRRQTSSQRGVVHLSSARMSVSKAPGAMPCRASLCSSPARTPATATSGHWWSQADRAQKRAARPGRPASLRLRRVTRPSSSPAGACAADASHWWDRRHPRDRCPAS